jgi:regulator of chromosome condensation
MPSLVLLGPKRGKGRKAVYVGAGSKSSFAVDEDGDVWGWGMNGQTGRRADGDGISGECKGGCTGSREGRSSKQS